MTRRIRPFPAPTEPTEEWRTQGACTRPGADPDLWFPTNGEGARRRAAIARRICNAACPVRDACRTWAIATRQRDGIWGGMTEHELRTLARNAA